MRSIDAKKLSMPIEGAYSYGGYYDVPEVEPLQQN